jgi:hypothetical protein
LLWNAPFCSQLASNTDAYAEAAFTLRADAKDGVIIPEIILPYSGALGIEVPAADGASRIYRRLRKGFLP